MRLRTLLSGVEGSVPMPEDVEIKGVSYDTRTIKPGEVFVALRGYKTDGHRHIPEARAKGCGAVIAEEGEGTIRVPDSRAALAVLSANWFRHPARELTLAGVTGTNGKTTVTSLLWTVLSKTLGTGVGLMGTNGIRVGEKTFPAQRTTPESYDLQQWLRLMADAGCTHAVMEVSSHALCLHRVHGLSFAVGAFTNLTQDHLDFHGTMEAYRQAKARLFAQSETGVVNVDDEAGRQYAQTMPCPVLTYAVDRQAALRAENVRLTPHGTAFRVGDTPVRLDIPGAFTVYNALCVLGCAQALGLPLDRTAAALAWAQAPRGRMERVPWPGPGTVVIDYAHTPDALQNALSALRPFTAGRLICLFGCGGDRDRTKRPVMGSIAGALADVTVVTSDNPRTEDPEAILADILAGMDGTKGERYVEPDRERAIALALGLLREGDALLLAGKGHETYQEVHGEKRHMDEREIVAKYAHPC